MGEMRNVYKILVQKPKVRDHSEDLRVDGRIILKLLLGKHGLGCGSGQGPVAVSCRHGNETNGSIRGGIFLTN
jgi:hypothetical protein